MTREERMKLIDSAMSKALAHPMISAWMRVGLAAMVEELHDLRADSHPPFDFSDLVRRLEALERENEAIDGANVRLQKWMEVVVAKLEEEVNG